MALEAKERISLTLAAGLLLFLGVRSAWRNWEDESKNPQLLAKSGVVELYGACADHKSLVPNVDNYLDEGTYRFGQYTVSVAIASQGDNLRRSLRRSAMRDSKVLVPGLIGIQTAVQVNEDDQNPPKILFTVLEGFMYCPGLVPESILDFFQRSNKGRVPSIERPLEDYPIRNLRSA